MHIYACMCICMYICVYIYIYAYNYMHIYAYNADPRHGPQTAYGQPGQTDVGATIFRFH